MNFASWMANSCASYSLHNNNSRKKSPGWERDTNKLFRWYVSNSGLRHISTLLYILIVSKTRQESLLRECKLLEAYTVLTCFLTSCEVISDHQSVPGAGSWVMLKGRWLLCRKGSFKIAICSLLCAGGCIYVCMPVCPWLPTWGIWLLGSLTRSKHHHHPVQQQMPEAVIPSLA